MPTIMNIAAPQNISAYPGASSLQSQSIQAVKSCFAEVLFSSLATGAACLFAATPQVAVSLIVLTVAILAINAFQEWQQSFLEETPLAK